MVGGLGAMALCHGDPDQAESLFHQSLVALREAGDRWYLVLDLEWLARVAATRSDWHRTVRLLSAADSLRRAAGDTQPPLADPYYSSLLERARLAIGQEEFAEVFAEGTSMSLDGAIEYALLTSSQSVES